MTLEFQKQDVDQLSDSNLADSRFEVDGGGGTRRFEAITGYSFLTESYPLLDSSQQVDATVAIRLQSTSITSLKRTVEIGSLPYFLKNVGFLPLVKLFFGCLQHFLVFPMSYMSDV